MSEQLERYDKSYKWGMDAFNRGNYKEAKRLLTQASGMLNKLLKTEISDDMKEDYKATLKDIKEHIEMCKSRESTETPNPSIPTIPEVIDAAKSTATKIAQVPIQTLEDWGVKSKPEVEEDAQSEQKQNIPKVDELFNSYVATFDRGMEAFNRGDAKQSKKFLSEAAGMLKTLISKEEDVDLKANYENLYKEINELIEMHLSEKEAPTVSLTQPNSSISHKEVVEPVMTNKPVPAPVQPVKLQSPLDQHKEILDEGVDAYKKGDLEKARNLISAANNLAKNIVETTSDATIKEDYTVIYERSDKILNNKLSKTKIEVQKSVENMER